MLILFTDKWPFCENSTGCFKIITQYSILWLFWDHNVIKCISSNMLSDWIRILEHHVGRLIMSFSWYMYMYRISHRRCLFLKCKNYTDLFSDDREGKIKKIRLLWENLYIYFTVDMSDYLWNQSWIMTAYFL